MAARAPRPSLGDPFLHIVGEDGLGTELLGGLAALFGALTGEPPPPAPPSPPLPPLGHPPPFLPPPVAPAHRRRHVARTLCTLAAAEAWRLHAGAILAKTTLLRTVWPVSVRPGDHGPSSGCRTGRAPSPICCRRAPALPAWLAQRRAARTGLSNSLATASMRTSSPRRPITVRESRRRPMRLKPAFS